MTNTETKIVAIPPFMVVDMWPHIAPFICKGLTAATNVTMRDIVDGVSAGTDQLWAIFLDGKVAGAFVTALYEEPTAFFVGVYALGGRGITRWGDLLGETMAGYALQSGASSVRFMGREAWSRVLPSFEITGRCGTETIFERAVQ
jgi:hypothetical protein